jgi:hypothetical protein
LGQRWATVRFEHGIFLPLADDMASLDARAPPIQSQINLI